jgi:hypothetical protein
MVTAGMASGGERKQGCAANVAIGSATGMAAFTGCSAVLAFRINQPLNETNISTQLPIPACFFGAHIRHVNQSDAPTGFHPRPPLSTYFGHIRQQTCVRVFCLFDYKGVFLPLKHERLYTRAQAKSIFQFSAKSEQSPSG